MKAIDNLTAELVSSLPQPRDLAHLAAEQSYDRHWKNALWSLLEMYGLNATEETLLAIRCIITPLRGNDLDLAYNIFQDVFGEGPTTGTLWLKASAEHTP